MPQSVRLLLLAVLLSLAETPASAPVHGGRGGWTLNSAGYLLGPVLPPPPRADRGQKEKTTLGILDLWRTIDGLPYSQSLLASGSLGETAAKAETGGKSKLRESGETFSVLLTA
ncbi:galanin-like peptide isoform X2 [Bos mutus]|uniref:galanin-like peptide isoform X2 n=1 Tax=Bos mutus TaxID=72004 RepID=UPI0038B49CE6